MSYPLTPYPPCPPFSSTPAGREQTITGAGVLTIDPAAGHTVTLAATGDVERIVILAGTVGARIVVAFKQAVDSRATWPVAIVGAVLAGGRFCKTTIANAVDVYSFAWIGGTWVECSRALWVA